MSSIDAETKEFVIKAIQLLNKDLISQINKSFEHVSKRFDDMEKRLESIESSLKFVSKDTQIIPKIFNVLEEDGLNIAELTTRVDKLTK